MRSRSVIGACCFVLVSAACSSSGGDDVASSAPEEMTTTSMSHMMGMSTGPDPEPAAVDASPYVFGILPNGTLPLDPGVSREVAVIAQGEPVAGTNAVPVVVRNMTRDTVYAIQGHVDLLDADEQVIDSGDFSFLSPPVVAPGEIAFGAMAASPEWDLSTGTLRAKVDSFNVMAPGPDAPSAAVITEASLGAGSVDGTAVNDSDTAFDRGIDVTIICFDTIRRPFHVASVEVQGNIPSGGSASFDIPLEGNASRCSTVLLAAQEIG